ncbi:Fatty acid synthase [Halotydeus destructor]|nr:Fatty acid synthase [Halotydeus destructor]
MRLLSESSCRLESFKYRHVAAKEYQPDIVKRFAELVSKNARNGTQKDTRVDDRKRPLWLGFSPMGCQWPGMARSLMDLPIFARSISKSVNIMNQVSVDMEATLFDDTRLSTDIVQNVAAVLTLEIAMFDVLRHIGLQADGLIGASLGEFACGYADGAISAQEALLTSHHHVKILAKKYRGKHDAYIIPMTKKQMEKRTPDGIHFVSDGGDVVAITGLKAAIEEFVATLRSEGIPAQSVSLDGIAFHTPLIADCRTEALAATAKVLTETRKRSPKWFSTTIEQRTGAVGSSRVLDAQYYVDNVYNEVCLPQAIPSISENAIFLEVGAGPFLIPLIEKQVHENVLLVPLLEVNNIRDNLDVFLSALAQVHLNGHQVDIERLAKA